VGDAGAGAQRWRVPVILRYPAGGALRRGACGSPAPTPSPTSAAARFPPGSCQRRRSGYYRWRVPDEMRDALLAARTQLSVRERIGPGREPHRAAARRCRARRPVHADDRQMAGDPEPEVLRAAMEAFDENRIALTTPRSAAALEAWVRTTFDPALRRLGWAPRPGEAPGVSEPRALLLRLLGDAGRSEPVLAYAESLAAVYRRSPSSVPPSLVDPGSCSPRGAATARCSTTTQRHFETAAIPSQRGSLPGRTRLVPRSHAAGGGTRLLVERPAAAAGDAGDPVGDVGDRARPARTTRRRRQRVTPMQ
jgi:aminopeptidase N